MLPSQSNSSGRSLTAPFRPVCLQVLKTPDLVSSVFFMCLPDKVRGGGSTAAAVQAVRYSCSTMQCTALPALLSQSTTQYQALAAILAQVIHPRTHLPSGQSAAVAGLE